MAHMLPGHEPRRSESDKFRPRFKFGLETPLIGRIVGENKKVVFAPPQWYESLILVCIVLGALSLVSGLLGWGSSVFFDATWRLWVGTAVCCAGVWALLSNERLTFDLRSGTYVRREGQGLFKHVSKGPTKDIDALVLIASHGTPGFSNVVVYRLVVHWKQNRLPLLVVSQWTIDLPFGSPVNAGSGHLVALGARYAHALQVPFFDNSYFVSPAPLRPL